MRHNKEEEWQSRLGTRTFNPLQVIALQEAISKRETTVTLEGRKFALTYQEENKVHYRPADGGFVPMGTLDISRFMEE